VRSFVAILMLGLSGCVQLQPDEDADAGVVFYAQGQTNSTTAGIPAVLWGVSSASPAYSYRFGKVEPISAASFIANFTSEPPEEALNSDGIGVATVVLFQQGSTIPNGKQPDGFGSQVLGFTAQQAILYKKPGSTTERWWGAGIEEGFSCGRCAAPPSGETTEGYTPTICSELLLEVAPQDACDWN
jgi:hypothetical protein